MLKYVSSISFLNQGLAFLHSCGVIHRDLKAGNVLLTETGDIKLGKNFFCAQVNIIRQIVQLPTLVGQIHIDDSQACIA